MCKESHRKLAESIWGMLLDFSVALFKGALLDGSTSRFASQVSARRKTGVRKPLSWDWRHPQHNTLMFRYLAIAVFIFVVFLFTLLSGWTWHCPLRRSCAAVCGRTHTHTRRVILLKEIKDVMQSTQKTKALAAAQLACWSLNIYFNGSLTPQINSTVEC